MSNDIQRLQTSARMSQVVIANGAVCRAAIEVQATALA